MDVKIALVGRLPIGGAVPRLEHLRNVPIEADGALGLTADDVPLLSSVVGRDRRKGEEVGEGQRLVLRRGEPVLLLRQITMLDGVFRKGGGGGTLATPRPRQMAVRATR